MNIFLNSEFDEKVYIELLNNYKFLRKIERLLQALYKLQ